jgi:two-component sensor histidine kinase
MTYLNEADATFPLSTAAPRAARRWLHRTGVVPAELAEVADLVVSELVTNSVAHSGLSEPDVVAVHIAAFPGGIAGEVMDEGRGIGADPRPRARSLGLGIIDRTVSRWGHTDHPTRVWFEVKLPRGRAPRSVA